MSSDAISPKERLMRVLEKKSVDRQPVICPGGMMNAAIVDVMNAGGNLLPDAHHDEVLMSGLSEDVSRCTGFENFGIPFCMTVEAEAMGSEIDHGSLACEPKVAAEAFPDAASVEFRDTGAMLKSGRVEAVIQACARLSGGHPDVPLIGNLSGPISTAASIVDPMSFLKSMRKNKAETHKLMEYVTDFLIAYANLMVDNGASVISIGDPTATGEILGPKMFEEYAVTYINRLAESINRSGAPVIVHICGNMNSVRHLIPDIRSQAISTDAMVNLRSLKEEYPSLVTMGNVSTYLLEFGNPASVSAQTESLVRNGIDIISPACGLSTSSSLENIRALTDTVKESRASGAGG
jgi:[methyl-Co(III) methanol-specific corrinoid protein]:coenzyme M methyltransferase